MTKCLDDKRQLVPLIQVGLKHPGFVLIDVLSPCVTCNDHEGSTKSYAFTRQHYHASVEVDFIPRADEVSVDWAEGESTVVALHDGSRVRRKKLDPSYDPSDRAAACYYIEARLNEREYVTGLIYIGDGAASELHSAKRTAAMPLDRIPYESLSPGGDRVRQADGALSLTPIIRPPGRLRTVLRSTTRLALASAATVTPRGYGDTAGLPAGSNTAFGEPGSTVSR